MASSSTSRRANVENNAQLAVNNQDVRYSGTGNISRQSSRDAKLVIFDVDTTDLSTSKEIIQISAWYNDENFNQCIIPTKDMDSMSSNVNKFEIRMVGGDRKLFHDRKMVVEAVGPKEGLTNFLDFLRGLQTDPSNQKGEVLLVAHECIRFDGPAIVREMKKHDLLDTFQSLVLGFVDTIPVFKSLLTERKPLKQRFALLELAKDYLAANEIPERRHATVNVKILQSLIKTLNCDDSVMKQQAQNFTDFIHSMSENVEDCMASLEPLHLTKPGEVPKTILKILAKAGISIDTLKDMHAANGDAGVTELLSAAIGEKSHTAIMQKRINAIISILTAPSTDNNAPAN